MKHGEKPTRTDDLQLRALVVEAKRAAQAVLERYGVSEPGHILLDEFAADLGAEVVYAELDGGLARLLRHGDRGIIRVSEQISNDGRRRYCVGHELGHFVMKHESPPIQGCTEEHQSQFGTHARVETQANVFATELLLPEGLVLPRCDVRKPSLRVCRNIAEDFQTSVTSAALRFVELTTEACALVFSTRGRVDWWVKGENFFGWLPERGAELDKWSMAARHFRSGAELADYPQTIEGDVWCNNVSGYLKEHSMAIPSIGAVLTMLINVSE